MPKIVLDCCVVSNFALTSSLGILEALYKDKAFITDFVTAEIMRGIQAGYSMLEAIPKAVRVGWLKETGLQTGDERQLFKSLSQPLGLGEASSIAIAKSRHCIFASDDRVARTEAAGQSLPLTGTLGILARAVRTGVCDALTADGYLSKMIDAGFFSPVRSIREFIQD